MGPLAKARLTVRGYEQQLAEQVGPQTVYTFDAPDDNVSNHFKVCDEYWQDGGSTGNLRGSCNDATDVFFRTDYDRVFDNNMEWSSSGRLRTTRPTCLPRTRHF